MNILQILIIIYISSFLFGVALNRFLKFRIPPWAVLFPILNTVIVVFSFVLYMIIGICVFIYCNLKRAELSNFTIGEE